MAALSPVYVAVTSSLSSAGRIVRPFSSNDAMPRSVVVHDEFDWGEDRQLRTRWRDTVIYELHVKGYTQLHNEIPEHQRGTYAGLGSHTVTRYLNDPQFQDLAFRLLVKRIYDEIRGDKRDAAGDSA